MTIREVTEKCSVLNVHQQRCITDDYSELVFYSKEIDAWNKLFTDIFGPAIKPVGVKASKDDLRLTKDYGGVNENQALFKKELDDANLIAMFWPWQDGIHTTLRVATLKK